MLASWASSQEHQETRGASPLILHQITHGTPCHPMCPRLHYLRAEILASCLVPTPTPTLSRRRSLARSPSPRCPKSRSASRSAAVVLGPGLVGCSGTWSRRTSRWGPSSTSGPGQGTHGRRWTTRGPTGPPSRPPSSPSPSRCPDVSFLLIQFHLKSLRNWNPFVCFPNHAWRVLMTAIKTVSAGDWERSSGGH